MLEVWIIDDSRADRGILSLLLQDVEGIRQVREFASSKAIMEYIRAEKEAFPPDKVLILCDSILGLDAGEQVLSRLALQIAEKQRYQVLMSGIFREESDWNKYQAIDNFMEKKGDLEVWRLELRRVMNEARAKLN